MRSSRDVKNAATLNPDGTQPRLSSRARILLADDNAAILDFVGEMLRSEYNVVGKVTDGRRVCAEVSELRPDIVVLDISMGDCSGIKIAQRLREHGFAGEIIFLTVHEDPDFVTAAFRSGGRAYVTKCRLGEDLSRAVDAVLSHGIFISTILEQAPA